MVFEEGVLIMERFNLDNYSTVPEKSIAKRVQIEDKAPVLSRNKSKMPYLHDAQTFFIEGLLNCGPKKAKLLLKEMDVPDEIIQCILKYPEKIESIKGFGEEFISQNNNMLKKRS